MVVSQPVTWWVQLMEQELPHSRRAHSYYTTNVGFITWNSKTRQMFRMYWVQQITVSSKILCLDFLIYTARFWDFIKSWNFIDDSTHNVFVFCLTNFHNDGWQVLNMAINNPVIYYSVTSRRGIMRMSLYYLIWWCTRFCKLIIYNSLICTCFGTFCVVFFDKLFLFVLTNGHLTPFL
jgi:hypothetical protein